MDISVSSLNFINQLPKLSGVYRFYGAPDDLNPNGELLYVGKASNLYNRVKSYFQKSSALSPRIILMVSKIVRIEITVTENEVSALILENNLIKSLRPKYNIVFRDDKSYTLIRLSKHDFPKIDTFLGKPNKVDTYFGPYPNSKAAKQNLELIVKLFKLRTCSDTSLENRSRPCMLYEIKHCTAPCVQFVTKQDYQLQVNLAIDFLNGKYALIIKNLTQEMYQLATQMEFEQASVIRDRLSYVKQISMSQVINSYKQPVSADIVFCEISANQVFVYLIILRHGSYVGDKHFVLTNALNSELSEVFEAFLKNYYLDKQNIQHIFTKVKLNEEFKVLFSKACGIKLNPPIKHQIKELYRMGEINLHKIVEQYQKNKFLEESAVILAKLLELPMINRIECIDVSHNHGDSTVASLVVYENGIIDNTKYRKYNLTKTGLDQSINGNDLLAMKAVLRRRFANKDLPIPEVILVDGGMLQLDLVKNILVTDGLYDRIRVISIKKGERRDPIYDQVLFVDGRVLSYQHNTKLFKLLQNLRDEAHRFAITGHRKQQINKMTLSSLNDIPLLGVKKKRDLLAYFGSVKNIAKSDIKELQRVSGVGKVLAQHIYTYFH